MKHNSLWMILGCMLPVLILFLLPALGFSNGFSVVGFLILMFGCHIMHMAMHKGHGGGDEN